MTTEHPWHPTDEVPSLKKTLSKLATCKEANRDKEKFLNEISESWYTDDREIQFAKEPPTTISKLGFVTKHGDLTHVRAITGCELPPSVTNSWNLPALGNPQLKIYDLAATKKESIAYLHYLEALLRNTLSLPPTLAVLNLKHTNIWLGEDESVTQIDLGFRERRIALLVLTNSIFRGSAHLLPTLRGQNHRRRDVHTRTFNIVKKEGEDCKGHLVERITKGTRNEKPTDATLRECIFLETTSVAAAQQLICDTVYDWGHDSKAIRLPSKAEDDTAGRREVAIIDPSQQVFIQHRKQLVARILRRVREPAKQQNKDIGNTTKAIFDGIVGTRQWAPSDSKQAETRIQWKRSGNGVIMLYAIFTSEAYDILAAAGKQKITVTVFADEDTGEKITTDVDIEIGRWSRSGDKGRQRQEQSRGPDGAASLRREDLLAKAANEAINRVESKAEEVLERAEKSIGKSTSAGSVATPETKRLLKRIDAKLGNLNQQTKESANTLEGLQIQHDKNAERRHRELTDGVDSFH
ncbi:hypothetical protein CYMTET_6924 [Cymbomonas tetramitiformis]|uniref:Uncharacterized protein n=1 Tax=Cymbomonas tetramitiformis TaxID=36881 RepID=A0AAE0GWM9_9CHLO|nr:hypothetical protein CYMTET_6924 [Cymbomonas tetramitiformis]